VEIVPGVLIIGIHPVSPVFMRISEVLQSRKHRPRPNPRRVADWPHRVSPRIPVFDQRCTDGIQSAKQRVRPVGPHTRACAHSHKAVTLGEPAACSARSQELRHALQLVIKCRAKCGLLGC